MPGKLPSVDVFRINTLTTYNVFESCRRLGIKNIVWASSETLLGIPYSTLPPYFPVDEDYPARPETAYCLVFEVAEDRNAGEIFLYEVYETATAFEQHLASDHFKAFSIQTNGWVERKEISTYSTVLSLVEEQQDA